MRSALDGIKVLDFSHAVAGPYCTSLLGDMGAEIIKVEPLDGEIFRRIDAVFPGGISAYFLGVNRNKQSIACDLRLEKSREVIRKLVEQADVVIQAFRPGVEKKLGLDYENLSSINPRIIYCAISAFGADGPDHLKPGMDLIVQAMSGIMSVTGEPGRPPVKVGPPVADFATSYAACYAISLALFARERWGIGQKIDLSLLDVTISLLANFATLYFKTQVPIKPIGGGHPQLVPYQVFPSKDLYLVVACMHDEFWRKLCKAMHLEHLMDDPRFATNGNRVINRGILVPMLEDLFKEKTAAEWISILEKYDIPCTVVNTFKEVFESPQVIHNQVVVDMDHPVAGPYSVLNCPVKMSETPGKVRSRAPMIGENTTEILQSLGYRPDEIDEMEKGGVVKTWSGR